MHLGNIDDLGLGLVPRRTVYYTNGGDIIVGGPVTKASSNTNEQEMVSKMLANGTR